MKFESPGDFDSRDLEDIEEERRVNEENAMNTENLIAFSQFCENNPTTTRKARNPLSLPPDHPRMMEHRARIEDIVRARKAGLSLLLGEKVW